MENSNKKVLIVEDDKSFLWMLKQSIEDAGFSVATAEDAEQGLKIIENEKPNLIILDIMLPKMDGIEMAQELKKQGNKTQIIFLTNVKDIDHINKALEVGTFDYVVKSDVHLDGIVEMVKKKLENR